MHYEVMHYENVNCTSFRVAVHLVALASSHAAKETWHPTGNSL